MSRRNRPDSRRPEPTASGPNFFDSVYALVREIPRGRVLSYGAVAALLGRPRGARAVGWALRALHGKSRGVPWHRVIASTGRISLPGESGRRQRRLLEAEGVQFRRGSVDMAQYAIR